MGFRFRKSVRLGKLVRLNFSGSGVSLGLGPPGLNVNLGPKGVRKTVGIPGSGLSYQTFSKWQADAPQLAPRPSAISGPVPANQVRLPEPLPTASRRPSFLRWAIVAVVIFGAYWLFRPGPPKAIAPPAPTSTAAATSSAPQVPLQASSKAGEGPSSAVPEQKASALPTPPKEQDGLLSPEDVREVQSRLKSLGFDLGPVDGISGPLTTTAIKRYQAAKQRPETGTLDRQLLRQVRQEPLSDNSTTLEVAVRVRVETPSRPVVYGATNLPDGAELIVTISRPESKFMAQDKIVVRNGQFKTTQFSQGGQDLNPGNYGVQITSGLAELQPLEVRAAIGAAGEKMSGSLVKKGRYGPTVEFSSAFVVGSGANTQIDAKARQQADQDLKQWVVKSCNDNIDLINALVRRGSVSGREIVGAEREKRVADCIKEVSR
jgi:peptidoglycan hydrolase-like protein with peptidoglycan-binding domain